MIEDMTKARMFRSKSLSLLSSFSPCARCRNKWPSTCVKGLNTPTEMTPVRRFSEIYLALSRAVDHEIHFPKRVNVPNRDMRTRNPVSEAYHFFSPSSLPSPTPLPLQTPSLHHHPQNNRPGQQRIPPRLLQYPSLPDLPRPIAFPLPHTVILNLRALLAGAAQGVGSAR